MNQQKELIDTSYLRKGSRKMGASRRMNELDGETWLRYSISVWDDIKKSPQEIKLGHPAAFPIKLVKRLIKIFTNKKDKKILDPFVGSGSAIVAADELDKTGIGFDTSPEFVKLARFRLSQLRLGGRGKILPKHRIECEDARNLRQRLGRTKVDFCITSPPYWDILKQKRTADSKQIRSYGDLEKDLGTIRDYDLFMKDLKGVFRQVYEVLRPNKYCCVIVMDLRKKDKFYPFHMEIVRLMEDIGFVFDDIIIWNRKNEYSNLRPLGYPSVFRVNKIHEFILIFKKKG